MSRAGGPFGGLLAASAISGIGDGLVQVAMPLLAAALTSDPRLVAGVVVAQRLPWVLLSLHGGALVDRLPLRRLLGSIEVVRGTALVGLAASVAAGGAELWLLYLVAFLIGTGDTVVASGLHAAVPQMVEPARLQQANGRIDISQLVGGEFLGPAIGGALFAVAAALPFAIDGASFLVAALLLVWVLPGKPAAEAEPAERRRLTAEVVEGLRWFAGQPVLRLLAVLIGAFALFQAAVFALLVLIATDRLALGGTAFGVFLAMGAVGNLLGAALAERLPPAHVGSIVLAAGGVTALAYVVLGATQQPLVAGAALVVEGVAIAAANVVTVSLRQRLIPLHLLGRVGAAFRLCIFGTMPVGALVGGVLADAIGVGPAVVAAGAAQLVVLAAVVPATRRLLSPERIAALDDEPAG